MFLATGTDEIYLRHTPSASTAWFGSNGNRRQSRFGVTEPRPSGSRPRGHSTRGVARGETKRNIGSTNWRSRWRGAYFHKELTTSATRIAIAAAMRIANNNP